VVERGERRRESVGKRRREGLARRRKGERRKRTDITTRVRPKMR
jgi:hypothetical protein